MFGRKYKFNVVVAWQITLWCYVLWQAVGWWLQSMTCLASSLPLLLKGRNRVAAGWPASTGLLTSSAGLVLQAPTLLWVQLHHRAPLHICLCMLHELCVSLCEPRFSLAPGRLKGEYLFIFQNPYFIYGWESHICEYVQLPKSMNSHWNM